MKIGFLSSNLKVSYKKCSQLGRLKKEDHEFKANLDYIVRPWRESTILSYSLCLELYSPRRHFVASVEPGGRWTDVENILRS